MKQVFTRSRVLRLTAMCGLTGMLAGLVTVSPARADDDWHFHRNNAHAHYDMDAVHRDENRLHDLYGKRRDAMHAHDKDAVRRLDRRITDARYKLDHDKYAVRRDRHDH